MLAENSELAIKRRSNGRTEPSHDSNTSRENKQLEVAIFRSSLDSVLIDDQEGPILEFNTVPSFSHRSHQQISTINIAREEPRGTIEMETLPGIATTLGFVSAGEEGQMSKRD